MFNSSLDDLVKAALAVQAEERSEVEARQAREREAARTAVVDALRTRLTAALTPELCDLLSVAFHAHGSGALEASGSFKDGDRTFNITAMRDGWRVKAPLPGRSERNEVYSSQNLPTGLLVLIGEVREYMRKHVEAELQRQREQIEAEARRKLQQQDREAAEKAEKAARQATHEAIAAEVAALQAAGPSWRWPEKTGIRFYLVRWMTGMVQVRTDFDDEDGADFAIDYSHGWALNPRLDADGFVNLLPTPEHPGGTRRLKLNPAAHLPTFEELIATCVEDLPSVFVERETRTLMNVRVDWNYLTDEPDCYHRDEEYAYEVYVGDRPVAWLREHIDRLPTSTADGQ